MRAWLLPALLVAAAGCKIEKIPAAGPFADRFDRGDIGDDWKATAPNYRISDGALAVDHAYNHPLWLRRPIPENAVIELDAWSNDDAGDIKLELWGDGRSYAQTQSYTATSYVFIFGGWHNSLSAIARMNEHGADRKTRADLRVEKGRHYHWRIARNGGHIDWQIDGQPFLTFDDSRPLRGADHAYLGFNNWEAEVHFDNVSVQPR